MEDHELSVRIDGNPLEHSKPTAHSTVSFSDAGQDSKKSSSDKQEIHTHDGHSVTSGTSIKRHRPLSWSTASFFFLSCLNSIGVVYGDIGTSPLYVFKSIFPDKEPDETEIKGALCLIIYSLTWVVCIKYLVFVLKADYRGEGGVFALVSLLLHKRDQTNQFSTDPTAHPTSLSRDASTEDFGQVHQKLPKVKDSQFIEKPKVRSFYSFVALIGAGLLLGDGVITPAISVLSALEGLELLGSSFKDVVVPLTCLVLVGLFVVQHFGTAKVGNWFGPIMVLWFITLAVIGIYHITARPVVFSAFNPYYGLEFFIINGEKGWRLMGAIVLCVTGCEAMYADMGHFGKNAVRASWLALVYPSLILNYLGQAAMLLDHPEKINNPFFEAIPVKGLFYPMLVLSTIATIIASQALISGAFSITEQAINLGTFPRMKVVHTSDIIEGQIYIPTLNYMLMTACIILVLSFKTSAALSNAYGLAVCGDMTLTTIILGSIALLRWKWNKLIWAALFTLILFVDLVFLSSTLLKIPYGGYVPLIIATIVSSTMYIWKGGKEEIHVKAKETSEPFDSLLQRISDGHIQRCPGTSVFMSSVPDRVPESVNHLTSVLPYLHERVVFLTIQFMHVPYYRRKDRIICEALPVNGIYRVIARQGYRETKVSIVDILNELSAGEPALFGDLEVTNISYVYSVDAVRSDKTRWVGHRFFISYTIAHSFAVPTTAVTTTTKIYI